MTAQQRSYHAQLIDAARSHWWYRGRERVVRAVAHPLARLGPEALVIDVGSGGGGPARGVFPHARIVAVDLSVQALKAYTGADGGVVADALHLPCRTGQPAAICAFDVLEHLPDDRQALRAWWEMLPPGGWLVLTVPAYRWLWSAHDRVNGHYRRYQAHHLRRLLATSGFRAVRMTYFNTVLLPGVAAVRWAQRLLGREAAQIRDGELDFGYRIPRWMERMCEASFSLESRWVRWADLPAGVSICAVARRRGALRGGARETGRLRWSTT